jgi:drug/metabolite transporter (DMT)-like permease
MKSKTWIGIVIMLICTVFTAVGQLFFKYSSETFSFNFVSLITNYNLIIGFLFYGLGAFFLIIALKFGDLSKIYPFVALNFVWVLLLSFFVLGEKINSFKINAVILIIFGVILIGGSK